MSDDAQQPPAQLTAINSDTSYHASPEALDWRLRMGIGLTSAWLGLATLYVTTIVGWSTFLHQPIDALGSFFEGAFAPLAFLWLVVGYFLQKKELSQNTDALKLQFEEIRRHAEQAVIQSDTFMRSELHNRQEVFLQIASIVQRHLGTIGGLLYTSSQGSAGNGGVSREEMSTLFAQLQQNDDSVFSRRLLELGFRLNEEEILDVYYGTEIRARHTNNFIVTFERLLERAERADPEGMIKQALLGNTHGLVYKIMQTQRSLAPEEFSDPEKTGIHIRTLG